MIKASGIFLAGWIGLSSFIFAPTAGAKPPIYPPFAMSNTQVRTLPVTSDGRHYALYIGLPESYGKVPDKKYPVVYVTDGYWDFTKVLTMGGSLAYDRVAPEYITVGLSYSGENLNYGDLRRWELSPAPFGDNGEASGHAAEFLKTLRTTIIPMIDSEYATDPSYRVLAGSSLGGLFTLYAMLNDPQLFQAYIASSPAVTVDNDWLFRYEETAAHAKSPTRLYVTIGGNESPNYLQGVIRFNQRMAARRSPDFDYVFHIVEDERHSSTTYESYIRGLQSAFLPLAPEVGPSPGD
ncbi:alpha/beta hydrolase [Asticcacaulis sp.]|uniref:alpha/beta hydrolase n=1 Tax=Asticcacaulis sp. TaxID=1872648 RepID=UPI003F7B5C37